jgi:hypothetical protein
MEPREAIAILIKLRDKYPLDKEEQEAVLLAMGVLDSAALSKNRIRGILAKRKNKGH